jgi:hypothetical protein
MEPKRFLLLPVYAASLPRTQVLIKVMAVRTRLLLISGESSDEKAVNKNCIVLFCLRVIFVLRFEFRKAEKMRKMTQEVGSQKRKRTDANVDRVRTLVRSDRRLKWQTNSRSTEYGNLLGGKDPNSGLTRGLSAMTLSLRMMR